MADSSDNSNISDNSYASDTSQTTEQSMKRQKREEVNNNIKKVTVSTYTMKDGKLEQLLVEGEVE